MDFWQFIKEKLTPWVVLKPGVTYDILASKEQQQQVEQETQILYDDKLKFLNEEYTEEKEALELHPEPSLLLQVPTTKKEESKQVSSSQLRKIYNTKQSTSSSRNRIGPANYSAMECHGFYGCIDCGSDIDQGCIRNLIIHTSKRMDTSHMLSLSPGDTIHVVYIAPRTKGVLRIRYVTRSKYFSPGSPITSVKVGVEGWDDT